MNEYLSRSAWLTVLTDWLTSCIPFSSLQSSIACSAFSLDLNCREANIRTNCSLQLTMACDAMCWPYRFGASGSMFTWPTVIHQHIDCYSLDDHDGCVITPLSIHSFIFIDQFQLGTMHRHPSSLWALCQHPWTSMVWFRIVVPFQLSLCQVIQEQVERSTITRQPSRAPIVWPTWLWWSTIHLASDEWLLEQRKGTISCTPLTINRVHDVPCKVINVNWFAQ